MNKQPFTALFNDVFVASEMSNRELAERINARLGAIPDKDTVRSTFKGRLVKVGPVAVTDRTISRWKNGVLPARKEWLEWLSEVLFPEMYPRALKRRWARQLRFDVADRYGVAVDEERAVKKEDVAAIPTRPLSAYLKRLSARFDTRPSRLLCAVPAALWSNRVGEARCTQRGTLEKVEQELEAVAASRPVEEKLFHKEHLWQAAAAEAFLAECPEWVAAEEEAKGMAAGLMLPELLALLQEADAKAEKEKV